MTNNKISGDHLFIHPDYVSGITDDVRQLLVQYLSTQCTDYYNYYPIANTWYESADFNDYHVLIYVDVNTGSDTFNKLFRLISRFGTLDFKPFSQVKSDGIVDSDSYLVDIGG
jgi:hypothetical protein